MPAWMSNGYYLTLALLLVCTACGILVAARFRRDVEESAPPTARDLLNPLEQAYFAGLMHPAEIERVRESVKRSSQPPAPDVPVKPRRTQADPPPVLFQGDSSCDPGPPHADAAPGADGG